MTSKRSLCKVKGLSEAKVDKIKEAAVKLLDCGFVSALEYAVKREAVFKITTGCEELDKLMGGGLQSMSITEAFGEFRTGKTQLSHTFCVTCQLPTEQSAAGGKAAFIDTEGTFRPDRLREIATRFGLDPEEVLDNVVYARAFNSEHQMDLITLIAAKMAEEPGKFRILIVDSIISLFRTDFSGRGDLGGKQIEGEWRHDNLFVIRATTETESNACETDAYSGRV
jgi:meiotic recombination protein DMC1